MSNLRVRKPRGKPSSPFFSADIAPKRPGWNPACLSRALCGRSHRSSECITEIREVIERTRNLARIPSDYRVAVLGGGATAAIECALWSLLGCRPVTVIAQESFGEHWLEAIRVQLKLDVRNAGSHFHQPPKLDSLDWDTDVVFVWNGATSGVCMPGTWSPPHNRDGLAVCDATAAVFVMPVPWEALDVITWSWQKGLGGEGQHGMIALSPRAVQRLLDHSPTWAMPRLFHLANEGELRLGLFDGFLINTPSMLCVRDYIDALQWAESVRLEEKEGLDALWARTARNYLAVHEFVERNKAWIDFSVENRDTRSSAPCCLKLVSAWFDKLSKEKQAAVCESIVTVLEEEEVAYGLRSYREAPPGFRFWTGPTVDVQDVVIALEWLKWAYETIQRKST